MKTITFQIPAWLSNPAELKLALENNPNNQPTIHLEHCNMVSEGWISAGLATVVVTLPSETTMRDQALAALEEAAKKLQADTTVKLLRLQSLRNDLLCLDATTPTSPMKARQTHYPEVDFTDQ